MSSQLLLRLFESSFFNSHLAVSYLKTYSDNIGISYYLVRRLAQFPEHEIEFYWPQLCHMLITRPTPSMALESFILERCIYSIHIANLTLFYLQASLSDLASNPSTVSFDICRRVLNRVHTIIFSDSIQENPNAINPSDLPLTRLHTGPSLIGLSLLLASVAQPTLVQTFAGIALDQARPSQQNSLDYLPDDPDSDESDSHSSSGSEEKNSTPSEDNTTPQVRNIPLEQTPPPPQPRSPKLLPRKKAHTSYLPGAPLSLPSSPVSASRTRKISPRPYLQDRRQSAESSPPQDTGLERSFTEFVSYPTSASRDGSPSAPSRRAARPSFLQSTFSHSLSSLTDTPSRSRLSFSHKWTSAVSSPVIPREHSMPPEHLKILLRAHACRTQLELFTSLQDISTRLIVVPKQARLSSLRAELTVLNHGLPRGCCLCINCPGESVDSEKTSSDDKGQNNSSSSSESRSPSSKNHKSSHNHHRIVRISPSEAVVLNSADRAPYLICVEVLDGDLDFDPSRRQNAEDVRQILGINNDGVPLKSQNYFSSRQPHASPKPSTNDPFTNSTNSNKSNRVSSIPTSLMEFPRQRDTSDEVDGDITPIAATDISATTNIAGTTKELSEEVDLVEQLYGDMDFHDPPFDPDTEYSPVIQNRAVDEETWNRDQLKRSMRENSTNSALSPPLPGSVTLSNQTNNPNVSSPHSSPHHSRRKTPLTLDEYAERMRMAAIMLSQLNASQHVGAASISATVTATVAGAGGGLIGMGMGIGAGIGGVVGAGFESMRNHLPFSKRGDEDSGQAGTGVVAPVDTTTATQGRLNSIDGSAGSSRRQNSVSSVASILNGDGTERRNRHAASKASISSSSSRATTSASASGAAGDGNGESGNASSSGSNSGNSPSRNKLGGEAMIRQRILSPTEAAAIKARIMSEMMALEEERMERMGRDSRRWGAASSFSSVSSSGANGEMNDEGLVMRVVAKDDPSGAAFREKWEDKKERIRKASPYGHLANWDVMSVIVKTGADLRQEEFAVQLIKEFGRIWSETGSPHWVRYFRILVTSESTGIIETITDAPSVHSIKKNGYARNALRGDKAFKAYTLRDYFVEMHGDPTTSAYRRAQDNFLKSLASYSMICYILQIKDRHNGNILVDREGHLIHIDFGFMLSNSPGSLGFEMAPFKLTQDYLDILGDRFDEFKLLLKRAFLDLRRHADRIIMLVDLMQKDSNLPCFISKEQTTAQLRERFQLSLSQTQAEDFIDRLVLSAALSVWTRLYDAYQHASQDIL